MENLLQPLLFFHSCCDIVFSPVKDSDCSPCLRCHFGISLCTVSKILRTQLWWPSGWNAAFPGISKWSHTWVWGASLNYKAGEDELRKGFLLWEGDTVKVGRDAISSPRSVQATALGGCVDSAWEVLQDYSCPLLSISPPVFLKSSWRFNLCEHWA